jgi:hypothetical protein
VTLGTTHQPTARPAGFLREVHRVASFLPHRVGGYALPCPALCVSDTAELVRTHVMRRCGHVHMCCADAVCAAAPTAVNATRAPVLVHSCSSSIFVRSLVATVRDEKPYFTSGACFGWCNLRINILVPILLNYWHGTLVTRWWNPSNIVNASCSSTYSNR